MATYKFMTTVALYAGVQDADYLVIEEMPVEVEYEYEQGQVEIWYPNEKAQPGYTDSVVVVGLTFPTLPPSWLTELLEEKLMDDDLLRDEAWEHFESQAFNDREAIREEKMRMEMDLLGSR